MMKVKKGKKDTRIGEQKENRFGTSGGGTSLDNWNKKKGEFSIGSERSKNVIGRRPRLILQPRSMPPSENQNVPTAAVSRNVAKSKGANLLGEARPMEQILSEKGQDPKVLPSDDGPSERKGLLWKS